MSILKLDINYHRTENGVMSDTEILIRILEFLAYSNQVSEYYCYDVNRLFIKAGVQGNPALGISLKQILKLIGLEVVKTKGRNSRSKVIIDREARKKIRKFLEEIVYHHQVRQTYTSPVQSQPSNKF